MIEIIAHMLISDGQAKENNTENKSLVKKKSFKCECIFRVKYVIFKPLVPDISFVKQGKQLNGA